MTIPYNESERKHKRKLTDWLEEKEMEADEITTE
jgi:hypothetical protein